MDINYDGTLSTAVSPYSFEESHTSVLCDWLLVTKVCVKLQRIIRKRRLIRKSIIVEVCDTVNEHTDDYHCCIRYHDPVLNKVSEFYVMETFKEIAEQLGVEFEDDDED